MYAIGVEALVDGAGKPDKLRDFTIRDRNMDRSKRLLLVEAPNMQLMYRQDPRDLLRFSKNRKKYDRGWIYTSSRSYLTSPRSTPEGTLSSRIVPDFLTGSMRRENINSK
jgi:hypothetical protein